MAAATSHAESGPKRPGPLAILREQLDRLPPLGLIGLVFVAGGAILQLVAFLAVDWLDGSATPTGKVVQLGFTGFGPLTQRGFAHIYFAWGAWLLLVLVLGVGIAACVPNRWQRHCQIAGAILGVLSAVATIAGVLVFVYQTDSAVFHFARNYSLGVYLAMLGFVASAFGAAAGKVGI